MDDIDFEYDHNGITFYRNCFERYIISRNRLNKSEVEWSKLIPKIEEIFFWLIKEGKKKIGIDSVNELIQKPDSTGSTCFILASGCSQKITKYILDQNIKINGIQMNMLVPSFRYAEFAEVMMAKNINPKVICLGTSDFEAWPLFQNTKYRKLADEFPRSIHFVFEDTRCEKNCQEQCDSKLQAFFYKNGHLVDINEKHKLGSGGFGSVYAGKWHGNDVAMKCILLDEIQIQTSFDQAVSEFENEITEYRSQLAAKGSGVVIPLSIARQQNREFQNGQWVALNFNVYIYPKYDCNLSELHHKHYQFNDIIFENILNQCLIRK